MTAWLWVLLLPLGGYLCAAGYLFAVQRRLMYPGDPLPPVPRAVEGRLPEVVETQAADGVTCRHWYWPPRRVGGATLLLFHGNAGHLGDRAEKYRPLVAAGYGLLLAGYRGYGGNPGKPSQAGLLADARAVAAWAIAREQGPLLLYGESLGAAVALPLAAEGLGHGLVLEAPFDVITSVAAARYWWLPVRLLVRDRWDSLARIPGVAQPLLWIHGTADPVTPLALGRRLYEAARCDKRALVLEGAGHCDFWDRPEVAQVVLEFLAAREAERRAGGPFGSSTATTPLHRPGTQPLQ